MKDEEKKKPKFGKIIEGAQQLSLGISIVARFACQKQLARVDSKISRVVLDIKPVKHILPNTLIENITISLMMPGTFKHGTVFERAILLECIRCL